MTNLQDVFPISGAAIDLAARDKADLIRRLSQTAAELTGLPIDMLDASLSAREQLGSTGLGDRIALPHARLEHLERPLCLLTRLRKPIDFGSVDGQPVDLVVTLLLPRAMEKDALKVLAAVARRIRERDVVRKLRGAKSAAELRACLVEPL